MTADAGDRSSTRASMNMYEVSHLDEPRAITQLLEGVHATSRSSSSSASSTQHVPSLLEVADRSRVDARFSNAASRLARIADTANTDDSNDVVSLEALRTECLLFAKSRNNSTHNLLRTARLPKLDDDGGSGGKLTIAELAAIINQFEDVVGYVRACAPTVWRVASAVSNDDEPRAVRLLVCVVCDRERESERESERRARA